MKYKYIIGVFLVGVIVYMIAALQKIMHMANADLLFKISTGIMMLAVLLGIIKIISTKDKGSILNK